MVSLGIIHGVVHQCKSACTMCVTAIQGGAFYVSLCMFMLSCLSLGIGKKGDARVYNIWGMHSVPSSFMHVPSSFMLVNLKRSSFFLRNKVLFSSLALFFNPVKFVFYLIQIISYFKNLRELNHFQV